MQPLASVAVTVIGKLPVTVGVPERVPPDTSVSPFGSVDAVANVTVPIPPECVKANAGYATFTVPCGTPAGRTLYVWQLTTSV